MDLHGSLSDNLSAALRSMRRLRGHAAHQDTVDYWYRLIGHAQKLARGGMASPEAAKILSEVSLESAERLEHSGQSASAK